MRSAVDLPDDAGGVAAVVVLRRDDGRIESPVLRLDAQDDALQVVERRRLPLVVVGHHRKLRERDRVKQLLKKHKKQSLNLLK